MNALYVRTYVCKRQCVFFSVARHYIIQLTRVKWFEYQNAHKRQIQRYMCTRGAVRKAHNSRPTGSPLAEAHTLGATGGNKSYCSSMKTKTRGRKRVAESPRETLPNAFTRRRFCWFDTFVCCVFGWNIIIIICFCYEPVGELAPSSPAYSSSRFDCYNHTLKLCFFFFYLKTRTNEISVFFLVFCRT